MDEENLLQYRVVQIFLFIIIHVKMLMGTVILLLETYMCYFEIVVTSGVRWIVSGVFMGGLGGAGLGEGGVLGWWWLMGLGEVGVCHELLLTS